MFNLQEFEDFYRAEYNNLLNKVSRRAGGIYNAEDVVQEAFTRCLTYRNTFEQGSRLSTWFNKVLYNALNDFQREERALGMSVEYDEDKAEPILVSQTAAKEARRIQGIIQSKPEPEKSVLELYFVMGYKPRDIVRLMPALSGQNVRIIVHRFKKEVT